MWLQLRVEITITMGRTTVRILFSGPTCTSALDDASKNLFTFDGYVHFFYFTLRTMMANPLLGIVIVHFLPNLMISSSLPIGGDTQTAIQFWGTLVNFEITRQVNANDEILFAFNVFIGNSFLKLTESYLRRSVHRRWKRRNRVRFVLFRSLSTSFLDEKLLLISNFR